MFKCLLNTREIPIDWSLEADYALMSLENPLEDDDIDMKTTPNQRASEAASYACAVLDRYVQSTREASSGQSVHSEGRISTRVGPRSKTSPSEKTQLDHEISITRAWNRRVSKIGGSVLFLFFGNAVALAIFWNPWAVLSMLLLFSATVVWTFYTLDRVIKQLRDEKQRANFHQ